MEVKFKEKTFIVDQGTTHPAYSLFTFTDEEAEFRNKYWNITDGDVVIDVGSSYGSYALTACVMGATVYCFEPESTVYQDLVKNINLNNWNSKCIAYNCALWDSVQEVDMRQYATHWPAQTITSKYMANTLDNIVVNKQISKIDWIKIDVEGVEEKVLKGAANTISQFTPNLIIECHNFIDADISKRVKDFINTLGEYDIQEVNRDPCIMIIAKAKKNKKKIMKIGVILGAYSVGSRPLDFWFNNIWDSSRGLTGTDLCFVKTAQVLAKRGHEVHLFTVHAQPDHKPDYWENVKIHNLNELSSVIDDSFDGLISINEPDVFRVVSNKPVRIVWQMLNDFPFCQPGFEDYVDNWFGVCEEHTEFLKKQVTQPQKWNTLSLGCCPEWYQDLRVPGRVIWCSSADRGLHLLLSQWPKIKMAVPHATLRVFYHFNYSDIDKIEPQNNQAHQHLVELGQRIRYIKYAMEKLKNFGVTHVGSISREQMKKEFNEASVFGFSCDTVAFSEGFSVATLEAHASFTVPIITSQDCLGSVYKNSGAVIIPSPVKDNLDQFTNEMIHSLTDKEYADNIINNCRIFAKQHTWDESIIHLENIIANGK